MKLHLNQSKKKSHTTFIWSLLIGTTMLFVGLAIGLSVRTPIHTDSVAQETPTLNVITEIPTDANANALPVVSDEIADTEMQPENDWIETDATDPEAPDTGTLARREELQYLQEVLPDNLMIPAEKTPEQVDALFAEFEQHRQLQELINSGKATQEDRERYYELRMKKYDEEIALINLCNDVASNSMASADERQAQLCSHIADSSEQRLQVINESIEALEQQVLFSARNE